LPFSERVCASALLFSADGGPAVLARDLQPG
jgi:hypothetical protein